MNKIKVLKFFLYAAMIVLLIICFVPFLMMLVNATRTNSEILKGFTLIPGSATMDNYATLIQYMNVWRGFTNSLVVAVSVTVLNAYFSALTAFALVVYNFKGKNAIFVSFLVLMMVPGQLGLIGLYDLSATLGLLNTYWPLIVPAVAAPFTVFFFRQYMITTMHVSLLEAARIDGASEIYMFHRIVIPVLMPAMATMGIFTFIGSWNNYITPLVILRTNDLFTLPVMMGALRGSPVAMNLGAMYLGIAISVVPIMIAFLFLSRYIISSISAGAIKE